MNATVFISTTGKGLARAARDTDGDWSVETLLDGQQVNCLAVDPHHADTIWAGTQGDGLLRSEDRGKTWQSAGLDGQAVKSIDFCQADASVIYVGTKPPAIFVSRDGGQNWSEMEAFRAKRQWFWNTPAEAGDPYVMGLAVSPTDPNQVIAGVELGATMQSMDGGVTWSKHLKRTCRDCHSLTFHATDSKWVYQGGGGWPAAFSKDGGLTWKQPKRGLGFSFYGWAVAADPERPEIWYLSAAPLATFPKFYIFPTAHWDGRAHASIFRSTEKGHWERLKGGLPQPLNYMAYALVTDPTATGHLYAGLSNGDIWHTEDYGDTWTQLPVSMPSINHSMVMLS